MITENGTCLFNRGYKVLEGGCSMLEITCKADSPRKCEYIDGLLLQAYLEKKAELSGILNHIVMEAHKRKDMEVAGDNRGTEGA